MATTHFDGSHDLPLEDGHPVWRRAFSRQQRHQLLHDDLEAGVRIPIVLTGIVLFGLTSMVFSVWLLL